MTKRCRRIVFEHNGERKRIESAWTWECSCGATESHRTQAGAHQEWMYHKTLDCEIQAENDDYNNMLDMYEAGLDSRHDWQ